MSIFSDIQPYSRRWISVYFKPHHAFADLEGRTSFIEWMLPLVFEMSFTLCTGVATLPLALNAQRDLLQAELDDRPNINERQRALILNQASHVDGRQVIGFLMIPASVCFLLAAWSIVGKHLSELSGDIPLTYRQILPIAGYAALTLVPEAIIKTGWVLMTGSFNPPVHSGLFLNDAAAVTYWGTFLSGVDLFGLWFLYLLGLGIAQIGRGSYTITWSAIGFIWCLWIIIRKAVESLGSIYV